MRLVESLDRRSVWICKTLSTGRGESKKGNGTELEIDLSDPKALNILGIFHEMGIRIQLSLQCTVTMEGIEE
jgi:hypothetical protein